MITLAKSKNIKSKAEGKMNKKKVKEASENPEVELRDAENISESAESQADDPKAEMDPMSALQAEIDQLNDKYLRLTAEYQNYRKRVEKEKTDIFKYGTEKLFVDMLPIMDNFERALSAAEQENSDSKVVEGVKMIKKSLDELFEKNGVKKIEALNQPFDPIKHHAVMTVESDEAENEQVLEVFQDGYILNDKVIRPSMVKVTQ